MLKTQHKIQFIIYLIVESKIEAIFHSPNVASAFKMLFLLFDHYSTRKKLKATNYAVQPLISIENKTRKCVYVVFIYKTFYGIIIVDSIYSFQQFYYYFYFFSFFVRLFYLIFHLDRVPQVISKS